MTGPSLGRLLGRNLTLQGGSEAIALATGLATTLVLSRHLGVSGFGGFNYLFAFLYFFLALNDLGINTILVREGSREPERAGQLIGAMLSFRLMLAAVSMLVAWLVITVVGYPAELARSLAIFTLVLPLNALRMTSSIFQMRLRFEYGFVTEAATRLTGLGFILVAVWLGAGLAGTTVALVASEAIGAALCWILSARLTPIPWQIAPSIWAVVLRSSVPLGLSTLLVASTNRLDFLMLERMAGSEQIGLYAAAYKVTGLLERFPQLVMLTLYPVMAGVARHEPARLGPIYRRTVLGLGALAIPMVALVMWQSPAILRIFGKDYVMAAAGLRVLIWSTLCLYLAITGGGLLIAVGWERVSLAAWAGATGLNVALNLVWIPIWGYVGAAMATVVAYVFVLTCTLVAVEIYLRRQAGVVRPEETPA